MNDIITKNPSKLNNFTNLGYQTYLIAQEELDLMDKLFFDSFRLGEVLNDLKITEPVFREADSDRLYVCGFFDLPNNSFFLKVLS